MVAIYCLFPELTVKVYLYLLVKLTSWRRYSAMIGDAAKLSRFCGIMQSKVKDYEAVYTWDEETVAWTWMVCYKVTMQFMNIWIFCSWILIHWTQVFDNNQSPQDRFNEVGQETTATNSTISRCRSFLPGPVVWWSIKKKICQLDKRTSQLFDVLPRRTTDYILREKATIVALPIWTTIIENLIFSTPDFKLLSMSRSWCFQISQLYLSVQAYFGTIIFAIET